MRSTKIICTVGPKTGTKPMLEKLAKVGMNVVRINMSHGDHGEKAEVLKNIDEINRERIFALATLLDTKGPEIRSGDIPKPLHFAPGDKITFTISDPDPQNKIISVNYQNFIHDIEKNDEILIDGGMMTFRTLKKTEKTVICECIDGGTLGSRRHINIRGKSADLPTITDQDWRDIDFGIKNKVNFIALSFVHDANSVKKLKKYLAEKDSRIHVISKIESVSALPNLVEICKASDGIMVARGDLGAELPVEEVPIWQAKIVKTARELGKPVIVATEMLESMIENPIPTRAEVSDIATAVLQRADAIMLSGETAKGKNPEKAVKIMDSTATRTEKFLRENEKFIPERTTDPKKEIVASATNIANNINATAIIVFTRSGKMARLISHCRPKSPIFAFTNSRETKRQLGLVWGTSAIRVVFSDIPEDAVASAIDTLRADKICKKGDKIVLVADILVAGEMIDTVQIREI